MAYFTNAPFSVSFNSCVADGGYVYCVGNGAANFAPLSENGTGAWKSTNAFPSAAGSQCAVSSGYVYCVGGKEFNATYYAQISDTGFGKWTESTSLPASGGAGSCAASGDYFYCVGATQVARNGSAVALRHTYYSKLSSGGFGPWGASGSYPSFGGGSSGGPLGSCVTLNGYIYCMPAEGAVFSARVSGGSVGKWNVPTGSIGSKGPLFPACAGFSGEIYCVGGFSASSSYFDASNQTSYFSVSRGTASNWEPGNGYPAPTAWASCVVSSGYLYCVGGASAFGPTSSVYYAPVSSGPQPVGVPEFPFQPIAALGVAMAAVAAFLLLRGRSARPPRPGSGQVESVDGKAGI